MISSLLFWGHFHAKPTQYWIAYHVRMKSYLVSDYEHLFIPHQKVAQKPIQMWRSTFNIGAAQLRSVTQKSRRNHRSHVWTEAQPARTISGRMQVVTFVCEVG